MARRQTATEEKTESKRQKGLSSMLFSQRRTGLAKRLGSWKHRNVSRCGKMKTHNQMAPGCIHYTSTLQTNKKRCVPTLLRHPYMLEIHTLEMTRLQCDVFTAKKSLSYIWIRNTTVYLATEVGKMRAHGR